MKEGLKGGQLEDDAELEKQVGEENVSNMLTGLYGLDHKSRRWYHRLFYWLLSSTASKASLLYRRDMTRSSGSS
ncbi:hypothetical protein T12_9688 [Trichinella patagoniensis]|uniref:Uncharacterized protein n=1 Tax=Trichinella patagoniensis TaxID=990121 RepID=A0A0V0Z7Y2_9BILA|nr:hypothetical protein T12_9688 [Trichinella patagoniensis]